MPSTWSSVFLQGKLDGQDEWGTVADYSDLFSLDDAIHIAKQASYMWWLTYPRMITRVVIFNPKDGSTKMV